MATALASSQSIYLGRRALKIKPRVAAAKRVVPGLEQLSGEAIATEAAIDMLWAGIQPTGDDDARRSLARVHAQQWTERLGRVHMFGSSATGLATTTGDMDLCLELVCIIQALADAAV